MQSYKEFSMIQCDSEQLLIIFGLIKGRIHQQQPDVCGYKSIVYAGGGGQRERRRVAVEPGEVARMM